MKVPVLGLVMAASIGGCSESNSPPPIEVVETSQPAFDANTTNAVVNSASATSEAPAPKHNWDFKEGDLYGYIAGVSEEESKKGKAAGDVVMYRYAGFQNGTYRLENVLDGGTVISRSECGRPCVAIKIYSSRGVERLAYNPASVIGAAFQDAMNGQLVQKQPPRSTPRPTDSASEGPPEDSAASDENTVEFLSNSY